MSHGCIAFIMGLAFKRLTLFTVLALLLAYPAARLGVFNWPRSYDPLALPDLTAKPGFLTQWQMQFLDNNTDDCLLALSEVGIRVQALPDSGVGTQCPLVGMVRLYNLWQSRIRTVDTRCAIAARLYLWERHALQPLAKQIFGERVTLVGHLGSSSCRTMRGSSSLSEHATANAIDLAGFRLQNGRTIIIKDHWNDGGDNAKFLHAVRDSLCDHFNTTLSPDYNADHADHFHADMGKWQSCN